jgi:hypothetical protein
MRLIVPIVLCLVFLSAGSAEAQLCAGAPSFRDNRFQAGVTAALRDGAQGVGGSFGGGGEDIFAVAGVSVLNFSDVDSSATSVSGTIGADLQADQGGRVFVCPLGQIAFGVGPDIGPVDVSTLTLSGGGSVGVVASQTDALTVVPTFGLFAVHTRLTAEVGGSETTDSDPSGLASVGVGLIFNRNVAIVPEMLVPFSAGNGDAIFSIQFLFNFGR